MTRLQAALDVFFPPRCLGCGIDIAPPGGLCGACFAHLPMISGLVCDMCGIALPGRDAGVVHCDACSADPHEWARGRAAFAYEGTARRMILSFKHGDRTDLARPIGDFMARAAAPILRPDMLVVPVPLHRWRLFTRRFNQAARLAQAIAARTGLECLPDALIRQRRTRQQEGMDRAARKANQADSIGLCKGANIEGRDILLVDDVMTSGATLGAGAAAMLDAGASSVAVVVAARVAFDG